MASEKKLKTNVNKQTFWWSSENQNCALVLLKSIQFSVTLLPRMKEAVITALERFLREVVIDGWFWCQKVDEGKIGCCNYFATCRWSHQADNKSSISRKEEEEKNNRLKKRGKTWEKKQQQPVEEAPRQIIEEEVSRNNDATQHTWSWSRGKVMSQGANKLHRPFLANSIYSSDPISQMSINSCENQINDVVSAVPCMQSIFKSIFLFWIWLETKHTQ